MVRVLPSLRQFLTTEKTRRCLFFRFVHNVKKNIKDPGDRRFHAQPNACSVCGPHIWLQDREQTLATHETALKQTALFIATRSHRRG